MLCSAVSISLGIHLCQLLYLKTCKSADDSKTAISYWQLADPVGPYSFASPTCAGFAYVFLQKFTIEINPCQDVFEKKAKNVLKQQTEGSDTP